MPAKPNPAGRDGIIRPPILLLIRTLLLGAIAVACYLAWVSFGGSAVAGCGPESGCDEVLHSRWAYWLGIPVSMLAVLVYAIVFVGTLRLGRKVPALAQRKAWAWLVPGALLMIGAALWFAGLQWLVIKRFCPFCMTAHGTALTAAVLLLCFAPFRKPPEKPWQQEKRVFIPPALGKRLSLLAVAGLAGLVLGQVLYRPRTFVSKPVAAGVTGAAEQPKERGYQLFNGRIEFRLNDVPLIGKPDAPHVMVSLYDYTCHHCRTMHGLLTAVHHAFSNELAIISLPMPLDSKCNPTVTRTPPPHVDACEYARLGLAVWRAAPDKLEQFDQWVFAPPQPPPLPDTREFAANLVGRTALTQALEQPRVSQQLQQDISIYETNYHELRNGSMPQLIIGTNVLFGTVAPAKLFEVLQEQFGLTARVNPAQPEM